MDDYRAQLDEIREEADNPPKPAEGEEAEELDYDPNSANYRLYLKKWVGEVEISWNNQIEKVSRSFGSSVGRSVDFPHPHARTFTPTQVYFPLRPDIKYLRDETKANFEMTVDISTAEARMKVHTRMCVGQLVYVRVGGCVGGSVSQSVQDT